MLLTTFLQTSADEIATTVNEVAEDASFSLLGMASKGGWLMIVLAILSIVAIYVFAERLYAINHASKVDKNFTKDITDYLQDGKKKSALALCKKSDTIIGERKKKGKYFCRPAESRKEPALCSLRRKEIVCARAFLWSTPAS